jgi:hypothetical protein
MRTWVCKACGTVYPDAEKPPSACPICEDPRQYIPAGEGQVWLRWQDVISGHEADIREEADTIGIGMAPPFAIEQRALLVKSAIGNVLWD